MPGTLIHAYGIVKFCATASHLQQGTLDRDIAKAIMAAADQLAKGELDEQFPLSVWQSGSGTQTHMNVNEVLASVATRILNGTQDVHPNDYCNLGQSTNDSFPTALHIACVMLLEKQLLPALEVLHQSFLDQAERWQKAVKTGRTHLQDATPVTLGQEFSAYAAQLAQAHRQLNAVMPELLQLTMGGTAVGTGLNTHAGFAAIFCQEVSQLTGYDFRPSDNCFAGQAAHDAIVALSGGLNTLASSLNKIASDLRLMASGPRCGLGEIFLPANEPGSSIMPGKVNPSQCEMLNMVCAQVMGNHTTITIANAQGQFELNTFKPVIAFNILQSLQLLADAMVSVELYCIRGIEANTAQLQATMDKSLMLVTALTPHIGYDRAAGVVELANRENLTLREAVIQSGLMSGAEYDQLIRPELMLTPRD